VAIAVKGWLTAQQFEVAARTSEHAGGARVCRGGGGEARDE
jgi:hypothetical protein